ncbi:phosphoglycerate dehydrogenase [Pontibacillus litoralis]|uniref:D-3-phosphoglycerate dehydrogenase n=1 Tax=Pontibacillus litoralis JSM 072002 TaxID=1385512 RepID=A0A0A5G1B7_9BACI|nr:phosphoglycerate dehydrogenase [Pontibacillus litoralis]KGX84898.1 3-phosphoglycerate dehydrogenase [Pontibacillus litoralis JSM 072002]
MTYQILVSDPVSAEGLQPLLNQDNIQVDYMNEFTNVTVQDVINRYDALIVRSQTTVTKELLEAGTNLKVIGRAGVGVDNIDLEAATEQGIIVVNAPDGNTISTAEHTFAMMMALARHIPQAYQTLMNGKWDRKSFKGVELHRKTLGIIGMGRIGSEVARRAKACRMTIIAYDPFLTEERADKLGITKGSLEDIYATSDFITVHTPLTKETKHMIDDNAFTKMKQGVRILNCARGGIIEEGALLRAIESGIVAGAALDVFEKEPAMDHPLLDRPEVIATPHLGASTEEAQTLVAQDVSEEIIAILNGESFKNAVNMPTISSEVRRALQPYYLLGEKLGEMAIQLVTEAPMKVTVTYGGELSDFDTASLTRRIMKGLLSYHLGDKVNIVNTFHMAKTYNLTYSVEHATSSLGFKNLITVTIETQQGKRSISGTMLAGYGPRIIKIDDYSIDMAPEDHLLYIQHNDIPGMIGLVGTTLGKHQVNIATMQVGRKQEGGEAIMMLSIDSLFNQDAFRDLEQINHIHSVKEIRL